MLYRILSSTKNLEKTEWLKLRNLGVGGSDASIICNLNPWKSKINLYLEKKELLKEEEREENESMYWGTQLEDLVATEFAKRTGKKVQRKNAILQSIERPYILANVDRIIVGENSGLECKTTSYNNAKAWDDDSIPLHYQLQCQHYMYVTGWDKMYIACLVGGQRFILRELVRDEAIIEKLLTLEDDFWLNNVEKNIPPEVDGSESSSEFLNQLYPQAKDFEDMCLPDEAMELVTELIDLKGTIKSLETKDAEIENKLKMMLADNERGKVGKYLIIWKNVKSMKFDTKAFKKEHPDLHEVYMMASASRRFGIKEME